MKRFLVVLLIAYFSIPALGQGIDVAKADSFLNRLASRGLAMGSIAISKNGIIQYHKELCCSRVSNNKKTFPDADTKYRIGSITKMFTAVMIFQLVEEGKLNLRTKLALYFPDLLLATNITIADMLYHRSGLHDYTYDTGFTQWMDSARTEKQMLQVIRDKGSDFKPGSQAD